MVKMGLLLEYCTQHICCSYSGHLHVPMSVQVGECVAQFWRPNFDGQLYPYLPPHVTRPKEVKKLFVVPLPEKGFFEVVSLSVLASFQKIHPCTPGHLPVHGRMCLNLTRKAE